MCKKFGKAVGKMPDTNNSNPPQIIWGGLETWKMVVFYMDL